MSKVTAKIYDESDFPTLYFTAETDQKIRDMLDVHDVEVLFMLMVRKLGDAARPTPPEVLCCRADHRRAVPRARHIASSGVRSYLQQVQQVVSSLRGQGLCGTS